MRWRPGLSSLLRLAAVITIGLSLLTAGCAASTSEVAHVADEKEGWTRCDHDHSVPIAVICFQR